MAAYQQHQQMPSTPQSYMDIQGKFEMRQSTLLKACFIATGS